MSFLIPGSFGYSKRVAQPCSLTIGNFDGVHLGHQQLLLETIKKGKKLNIPSCVYTFEPSPRTLLAPHLKTPRIMSWQEKIEAIFSKGVDYVVVEEFSAAFAQHHADWFALEVIQKRLQAQVVTVGYDFRYGRARAGTVQELRKSLPAVEVTQIAAHKEGVDIISSSKIRELLLDGKVAQAGQFLGAPYCLRGVVVAGDQRGRKIGFPTANLETGADLIPETGVYAVQAQINRGIWYNAMVNLGTRPTFGGRRFQIEVHIFDFSEDIYGDEVSIRFFKRIRAERRFDSPQKLKNQLEMDKKKIRTYFAKNTNH